MNKGNRLVFQATDEKIKKNLCAIATKRIEDLRINLTKYVKD